MEVNATGEVESGPLRLQFDRSVKLAFHGSAISSDGGLLLHRELDDALGLTDFSATLFADPRTGKNGRHRLAGFLRQSVFSRLAGWEDVNDADRLCRDPVMRQVIGGRAVKHGAASASAMGRFETQMLTRSENLATLADLPGRWIDAVHDRRPPKSVTLDMDSSESPVHGDQEGAAWNGHFQSKCLHPLFVFNQFGDLERCALRPGNVHSAEGWEDVLKPVLARYSAEARPSIERKRFRADAAFAIPALFDLLETEGWDYAIRIKGNPKLYEQIGWLTKRRPGRPPNHVVREYTSFHYRAKSWSKPRRVVAKVEFHPGELFPRVGFIVTNRSLPNERVLAFYNGRGTAEQHIKEGQVRAEVDTALVHALRGQRRPSPASRTGLQPRQFPAHAIDARRDRNVVADLVARATDQDRRAAGAPRPLRRVPIRRGCAATPGFRWYS